MANVAAATGAAAIATGAIEELVVTARNRSERAQDVPVPISVIGGEQIDRDRAFTIADLTQRAPGLTATTPNARRTGVSIRGIGKTSGNDNMEAAVGVIVDDVFLGHVGMSYQDFTDLERVEVLRGPQGTLLGKNTTLGVLKYTSRAPSFTPGVDRRRARFRSEREQRARSYSNGIVDDVLAYSRRSSRTSKTAIS
jgi:iron complex outermembrane receptor protein